MNNIMGKGTRFYAKDKLREARRMRGVTLRTMAELITDLQGGKTLLPQNYAGIERRQLTVGLELANCIANLFQMKIHDLFLEKDLFTKEELP